MPMGALTPARRESAADRYTNIALAGEQPLFVDLFDLSLFVSPREFPTLIQASFPLSATTVLISLRA